MQDQPGRQRTFAVDVLPWIVLVVALAVFGLTLNPWVSVYNLFQVTRITGLEWRPDLFGPGFYVVTLPLRLLPASWIPAALNLFSALCAALALAQLARSVALLPHDRTHEQRMREISDDSLLTIPLAWLPVVLAVLACGLQLTFWERATNGTGEMFDLLLFSYGVRSLLEYRIDGRESRLFRAALVWGVGMADDYAMVGFLPAFIAAVLWIRGFSFFSFRFLTRMALCGLAGMLLYLLLPLIASMAKQDPLGFWYGLKANVALQKNILYLFPKKTLLILALTSLLPVFVLSIKWTTYFGDSSRMGVMLATTMFHFVHAALLAVGLWLFLDPPFSPRETVAKLPGYFSGMTFLGFYYLAALSVGYFCGYFLLVFRPVATRARSTLPTYEGLVPVINAAMWLVLFLLPIALLFKNYPQIRATNGPLVREFVSSIAEHMPKRGVVLSDDSRRLELIRAWLAREGRATNYLFLDTQMLKWPHYNRYLHTQHPQQWEALPAGWTNEPVDSITLINRMIKLSKDSEICYLHPSFGYYFEVFRQEPHGIVCTLQRFGTNSLIPLPPTPDVVTENEAFWTQAAAGPLKIILDSMPRRDPGGNEPLPDRVLSALGAPRKENLQAVLLGDWYSRSLNLWGVEMQKLGQLEKAAAHFAMAEKLNPDNVVARINIECNQNLQAGRPTAVTFSKSFEESLGKYRSLEQVLNENGPYDEPTLCYAQGWVFMQGRLFRQAATFLSRVTQFSPEDLPSRVALAQVYVLTGFADEALEIIKNVRSDPARFKLNATNRADLVCLEATALYSKKEPEEARGLLESAVAASPTDPYLLMNAATLYTQHADYRSALAVCERQLTLNPTNASVLVNKSFLCLQTEDFGSAIEALNQALKIQPDDPRALLNRAIACLRIKQYDQARQDYEQLDAIAPGLRQTQYGLAEIAWQLNDTNSAIRHYEAYMTNAVPNASETKLVAERLAQLKGEKAN